MANEKRLIELGEALRMVKNSREDCPETSIKGRAIWETAHNCALSCLTSCNAVDAVEVVHGRWIAVPSSDMMTGKAYKCSECNKMRYGSFMPNYCQNCGAKMDGDGNG